MDMPPAAREPERITRRICEAIKGQIASGLLGPGSSEHILGHDGGNHRNDQRSDEQRDFLDVHGDYASPTGHSNARRHSGKLVKKALGE